MSRVAKTTSRIAGRNTDAGIDAVPMKQPRFEITIALTKDNEGNEVFIGGATTGDVRIRRGKKVVVSQEIIDRLNDAVCEEQEPSEDGDPSKFTMVERQRFAFQIHRQI